MYARGGVRDLVGESLCDSSRTDACHCNWVAGGRVVVCVVCVLCVCVC